MLPLEENLKGYRFRSVIVFLLLNLKFSFFYLSGNVKKIELGWDRKNVFFFKNNFYICRNNFLNSQFKSRLFLVSMKLKTYFLPAFIYNQDLFYLRKINIDLLYYILRKNKLLVLKKYHSSNRKATFLRRRKIFKLKPAANTIRSKNSKFFYINLFNFVFFKLRYKIYSLVDDVVLQEIFVNFLKRKNYLNMLYRNFYYLGFIKKRKSNIYLTITNRHGDTIISQSFGKVGLYSRKKRKIQSPLRALIKPVLIKLLDLNIYTLECVYLSVFSKRQLDEIKNIFLKFVGVKFFRNYIKIAHHNRFNKKFKKIRRI